jgi:hypothetical protein
MFWGARAEAKGDEVDNFILKSFKDLQRLSGIPPKTVSQFPKSEHIPGLKENALCGRD